MLTSDSWQSLRDMRNAIADREPAAWVTVRPPETADTLAPLGRDLLTALGCVGLTIGRSVGERHLHRAQAYLAHSTITDLIVDEAQWLPEQALAHLLDIAAIAGVRTWLILQPPIPGAVLEAVADLVGTPVDWAEIRRYWTGRANLHLQEPLCRQGPWRAQLDRWAQPPSGCCGRHDNRVSCLLAAIRREIAAGSANTEQMRLALTDLQQHPDTTLEELWQLRAAGRDTYTPALDALYQLLPAHAHPADVTVDALSPAADILYSNDTAGNRIEIAVPVHMRPALARQRTQSINCNGPGDYPLLTLFDQRPISYADRPHRRRATHTCEAMTDRPAPDIKGN